MVANSSDLSPTHDQASKPHSRDFSSRETHFCIRLGSRFRRWKDPDVKGAPLASKAIGHEQLGSDVKFCCLKMASVAKHCFSKQKVTGFPG
jgi:hypothetical protein